MKKIFIDDETFYYRGRLEDPISNRIFLSKIKTVFYEYPQFQLNKTKKDDRNEGFRPHDELEISLIRIKEGLHIQTEVFNNLKKFHGTSSDYIVQSWVVFVGNSNKINFYHDHPFIKMVPNQWSFCYYVQTPNNLTGKEGMLMFKTEQGIEDGFLPDEGDLVIFPGNLQHMPLDTTKSTKERVVFCGNFSFLNTSGLKVTKSIL